MTDYKEALGKVRAVLSRLVAPEGCPWDKAQTPETLCEYLLEETYELVDAVRHGTVADVREELGDVLFTLYFIADCYERKEAFTLAAAMEENAAKMIRRHPHVFGEEDYEGKEKLLANWEKIKKAEKPDKGTFDSLPEILPPLLKAYRINSKAARAGFTWDADQDVEQQAEAEWLELLDALQLEGEAGEAAQEHELGDLLFTLVELGRRKGIKANAALDKTNARFLARFQHMEGAAKARGQAFADLDMAEKNSLWDEAKAALDGKKT